MAKKRNRDRNNGENNMEEVKDVTPEQEEVVEEIVEEQEVQQEQEPQPEPQPEPVKEEPKVEVKETPVPEPVKAPEPIIPTKSVVARTKEQTEVEKYLNDARTNGTTEQKRMLEAVERFSNTLVPRKPMNPSDAFNAQWEFLSHIRWLLAKDFEDFKKGWNTLLLCFYQDRQNANNPDTYSSLSEYNTDRYLDSWKRGEESANAYSYLMTLLRKTCNPSTRQKEVKSIVIERVGAEFLDSKAISNMQSFYDN